MDTSPAFQRALREIREHILRSDGLPVPDEKREVLGDYELRAAAPDQESVTFDVDVRVRSEDGSDSPDVRRRTVEITPQVMVDSPDGMRFFAGWNDVGRIFVVWFTDDSLDAIRERLENRREATTQENDQP